MHPLVAILEQEYGCRIHDVKERRRALLIDTDIGELAVKAYDNPDKACWVVTLCRRLRARGFQQTLEFLPSRKGYLFFHNGQAYTVSKKIEGRNASYRSADDLADAFSCLARFHQAARHIAGGPPLSAGEQPLVDKWSQRIMRFESIARKLAAKKNRTKTENLILRLTPAVLREARQVTDWLARSPYERQVNRARVERRVAHRDLANHNFLIGRGDDKAWLIDYDTAAYDSQLVDVIQMLGRVMVQKRWDFDLYADLLETYGQIVSLSEEDRSFIYVMLKFPDDIMREVNGYYERQPGYQEEGVHYVVRRTDRDWEQRQIFFRGVKHFLRKIV